jgi:hypothetical protein
MDVSECRHLLLPHRLHRPSTAIDRWGGGELQLRADSNDDICLLLVKISSLLSETLGQSDQPWNSKKGRGRQKEALIIRLIEVKRRCRFNPGLCAYVGSCNKTTIKCPCDETYNGTEWPWYARSTGLNVHGKKWTWGERSWNDVSIDEMSVKKCPESHTVPTYFLVLASV